MRLSACMAVLGLLLGGRVQALAANNEGLTAEA